MMIRSKRHWFWIPNSTWLARTALDINKIKINLSYAQAVIPPNYTISANNSITDTGATIHYIQYSHQSVCTDNQKTTTGPKVHASNGDTLTATHSVKIPLSTQLSKSATHCHILDHFKTGSLISIGNICDDDWAAIFAKYHVHIIKCGFIIIKGSRNNTNGLCNIPIAPKLSTTPSRNIIQNHTVLIAINSSQKNLSLQHYYTVQLSVTSHIPSSAP